MLAFSDNKSAFHKHVIITPKYTRLQDYGNNFSKDGKVMGNAC